MSSVLPLSVLKDVATYADTRSSITTMPQVSSAMRRFASGEMRFRHRALFEKITDDVERLHAVMRKCNAVLGGSAVLQLVCPIFQDVNDYDFFVPLSGMDELVNHFVAVDGFRREDEGTYPATNGCAVGDLHYLSGISRRVTLVLGELRVDIIGVGIGDDWDSVLRPIASSWTTLLFNYSTADWVVVGYPSLTLQGRGLVQWEKVLHWSFPGAGTSLEEMKKYQDRGFEFRTHADDWDVTSDGVMRPCSKSWVCPLMTRAFGDAGCLRLAVGQVKDAIGDVKWKFGGVPCPLVCEDSNGEREETEVHVLWCACF